jgi:hypothetical protein
VQVDHATGRGRHEVEEARVPANVADERFGLDLLPGVRVDVAAERRSTASGICVGVDAGERAVGEDSIEIEVVTELPHEQWMEVVQPETARQEVGVAPSQFASARAREQKPEPPWPGIHDGLDGIEKRRHALDLVNEDGANIGRGGQELALEPFRLGHVLAKRGRARQIQRAIGSSVARSVDLPTCRGPRSSRC